MNQFQSIESGSGLLKNSYQGDVRDQQTESPMVKALRERRKRLTEKIAVPSKEEAEGQS